MSQCHDDYELWGDEAGDDRPPAAAEATTATERGHVPSVDGDQCHDKYEAPAA